MAQGKTWRDGHNAIKHRNLKQERQDHAAIKGFKVKKQHIKEDKVLDEEDKEFLARYL